MWSEISAFKEAPVELNRAQCRRLPIIGEPAGYWSTNGADLQTNLPEF